MMKPNPQPQRPYLAHREKQRERILAAAERLFVEHGIDRVSLSDIARAAGITRKTFYEYFPNKQEVVWSIFQKIVDEIKEYTAGLREPRGNGFHRVEQFMAVSAGLLETHPRQLRFVVEFNTLYSREGDPARVRRTWDVGEDILADLIAQGIADGSIRPDLDPRLLSAAMMNLLNALNSRFALLGSYIGEEYGQPVKDMYREICRAFLRGIQNTPSSKETAA